MSEPVLCKLCGAEGAASRHQFKEMRLFVCAACDFHFIDARDEYPEDCPAPRLTKQARAYIEQQLPGNGVQLQRNLAFVRQQFDPRGRVCLDVGAGAGQFGALLREAGGTPHGIEPQQVFREFALEKYRIELRRERVDDPFWLQGFAGSFDLVTLWDTIEHVNDPRSTLEGAFNLLKPGGWLFLDTPSRDTIFYRASLWSSRLSSGSKATLLNRLYSPRPYRHKQLFTAEQLCWLLEKCGFEEIRRSPLHRSRNKLVVCCRKQSPGHV